MVDLKSCEFAAGESFVKIGQTSYPLQLSVTLLVTAHILGFEFSSGFEVSYFLKSVFFFFFPSVLCVSTLLKEEKSQKVKIRLDTIKLIAIISVGGVKISQLKCIVSFCFFIDFSQTIFYKFFTNLDPCAPGSITFI